MRAAVVLDKVLIELWMQVAKELSASHQQNYFSFTGNSPLNNSLQQSRLLTEASISSSSHKPDCSDMNSLTDEG